MKIAPRDQVSGNSAAIAAEAGVNSQFTATACLLAAPAFVTENVFTVFAQHLGIVRLLRSAARIGPKRSARHCGLESFESDSKFDAVQ